MKRFQIKSIKIRFMILMMLISIMPVIIVGVMAQRILFENIRAERIKTIGSIANGKHDELTMVLKRANNRATELLSNINSQCNAFYFHEACSENIIKLYLLSENALGATLNSTRTGKVVTVGISAVTDHEILTFQNGQYAKFSGRSLGQYRSYFILVSDKFTGYQLSVTYPVSNLQPIFNRPSDLGSSGETFLADGDGYFVTQSRYHSVQGVSHPIHARPMQSCLHGENKEVLDLDYRDHSVIHGFRFIPEFGAACIMAHADQKEMFLELAAFEEKVNFIILISVAGIIGLSIYVTRRFMKAEQSQQHIEQKFHIFFENANDVITLLDDDGIIADINFAGHRLLGYSKEEMIGKHITEFTSSEVASGAPMHMNELLKNGRILFESSLMMKNGKSLPVEINAQVMNQNDRQMIFSIHRDLTERKKLFEQIGLFAKVFENSVEAMMITDSNNRIVNINPSFSLLTGYSEEDVFGKDPKILSSGKESPDFYKEMWQCLRQKGVWSGEITDRRKDGTEYPKLLSISTLRDEQNKIVNYIASFVDISERKQIETMLEQRVKERTEELNRLNESLVFANRAKNSFLATMSHEIRTPLSGMLGMLELLNLSNLQDGQRETLQTARDSGKSLLRILNDILDWSKIEEGKLILSPQPSSHIQLILEVVNTYSFIARKAGLSLRAHTDPQLSSMHIVDALRLSEILGNFVSNALKFTQEGDVEVWDELIEKKDGMERIRFSVRDSGIGIKKSDQPKLFQVYGQASSDTARMYGGTGLGLAICRRLADLMAGEIQLESSLGNGSTFSITLTLPVAADQTEEQKTILAEAKKPQRNAAMKSRSGIQRVLVADDNPVNVMLMIRQLEQLGLSAFGADDGKIALSMWNEGQFDMVITDCHMPNMNGYQLSAAIRENEAEQFRPHIPIIACTANALPEENELCRLAGMDEVIVKPVSLAMLRSTISNWISIE